jgi:hypothetical protein
MVQKGGQAPRHDAFSPGLAIGSEPVPVFEPCRNDQSQKLFSEDLGRGDLLEVKWW